MHGLVDEFAAAFDASFCDDEAVTDEGPYLSNVPCMTELTPYVDLVDCGDKPMANVVSISYHLNPDIHEDDITPVIQRQCTEFGKVQYHVFSDCGYHSFLSVYGSSRSLV